MAEPGKDVLLHLSEQMLQCMSSLSVTTAPKCVGEAITGCFKDVIDACLRREKEKDAANLKRAITCAVTKAVAKAVSTVMPKLISKIKFERDPWDDMDSTEYANLVANIVSASVAEVILRETPPPRGLFGISTEKRPAREM